MKRASCTQKHSPDGVKLKYKNLSSVKLNTLTLRMNLGGAYATGETGSNSDQGKKRTKKKKTKRRKGRIDVQEGLRAAGERHREAIFAHGEGLEHTKYVEKAFRAVLDEMAKDETIMTLLGSMICRSLLAIMLPALSPEQLSESARPVRSTLSSQKKSSKTGKTRLVGPITNYISPYTSSRKKTRLRRRNEQMKKVLSKIQRSTVSSLPQKQNNSLSLLESSCRVPTTPEKTGTTHPPFSLGYILAQVGIDVSLYPRHALEQALQSSLDDLFQDKTLLVTLSQAIRRAHGASRGVHPKGTTNDQNGIPNEGKRQESGNTSDDEGNDSERLVVPIGGVVDVPAERIDDDRHEIQALEKEFERQLDFFEKTTSNEVVSTLLLKETRLPSLNEEEDGEEIGDGEVLEGGGGGTNGDTSESSITRKNDSRDLRVSNGETGSEGSSPKTEDGADDRVIVGSDLEESIESSMETDSPSRSIDLAQTIHDPELLRKVRLGASLSSESDRHNMTDGPTSSNMDGTMERGETDDGTNSSATDRGVLAAVALTMTEWRKGGETEFHHQNSDNDDTMVEPKSRLKPDAEQEVMNDDTDETTDNSTNVISAPRNDPSNFDHEKVSTLLQAENVGAMEPTKDLERGDEHNHEESIDENDQDLVVTNKSSMDLLQQEIGIAGEGLEEDERESNIKCIGPNARREIECSDGGPDEEAEEDLIVVNEQVAEEEEEEDEENDDDGEVSGGSVGGSDYLHDYEDDDWEEEEDDDDDDDDVEGEALKEALRDTSAKYNKSPDLNAGARSHPTSSQETRRHAKKGILRTSDVERTSSERVRFSNDVQVAEIPRLTSGQTKALFYSEADIALFTEEADNDILAGSGSVVNDAVVESRDVPSFASAAAKFSSM